MFVVETLGRWERAVVLHADIDDIGWVPGDASSHAGDGGHENQCTKGRRSCLA